MENLSFAMFKKYCLRRLLLIFFPDYMVPSKTIRKELIMNKYNKCAEALKKEII